MSLSLMASVASLAVKLGPTVIRGVSSLFGGSDTADKVANIVEVADKLTDQSDKENLIMKELGNLPPESLAQLEELKIALEKENTRRLEIAAQDAQAEHEQAQATIRNGDVSGDPVVRRSRPRIAFWSFIATAIYVISMSVANAYSHGTGPDMAVAGLLMSPCVAYLGLRHREKTVGTAS
ncbi:hypothetical protein AAFX60_018690 [Aliivibrio fischeri]